MVTQEASRVGTARRARRDGRHWATLAAISAGGAVGALARLGVATALPARPGAFPWATFVINVTGCLLIGVLMVLITEALRANRLVRPFLGVGVLGGYTTFSTYVVDIQRLIDHRAPLVALVYMIGTVVAALASVYAGVTLTRWAVGRRRRRAEGAR